MERSHIYIFTLEKMIQSFEVECSGVQVQGGPKAMTAKIDE